MNRYTLLLIIVGLQINISNSISMNDIHNAHSTYATEKSKDQIETLKKQILMDRLKSCHKYPEETIILIDEVEKKIHQFVGDNLDEEQQNNISRFKDVCNEHIIKITKKLSDSDRKAIKEFADGIIWTCWNGFGLTKEIRVEQWGPGGIAYLARGSLGEDVFKKMAEYCKDERKRKY